MNLLQYYILKYLEVINMECPFCHEGELRRDESWNGHYYWKFADGRTVKLPKFSCGKCSMYDIIQNP